MDKIFPAANQSDQYTIKVLLDQASEHLNHIETAKLDSEIIMCHILNIERSILHAYPERIVSVPDVNSYVRMIEQRARHIPVSYLTGRKEFWSMEFMVDNNTLTPRPETEHLLESALKLIPDTTSKNVLDLGTGCGAIAISVAKERSRCQVTAVDISEPCLIITKQNMKKFGIKNMSVLKSHWFSNLSGKYDFIISNPPYIRRNDPCLEKGGLQFEPRHALVAGNEGLDAIRIIIDQSPAYLNDAGWLLLEHGCDQGKAVRQMLESTGFGSISTIKDYSELERVSTAQYRM